MQSSDHSWTCRRFSQYLLVLLCLWGSTASLGQKKYDPGASDTEIRIGQTLPYSGPVSMLGNVGKVSSAYLEMINAQGGINGRKIKLISLDDSYSPVKTMEATRRLVENEEVLFLFGSVGTATNQVVHRYLNQKKIPQLLILSGANKWNDPANFPWTLSGMFSYEAEARVYAKHMLSQVKDPRIAVLSQNDEFGRDFMRGLRTALGDKATSMIVGQATYEATDPTVDSQMIMLKATGANVLMSFTNGKFTSQSIRKAAELGWKPQIYVPLGSSSIASILQPAGLDNALGAVTIANQKNPLDPQWRDDPGMKDYKEFMKRWAPALDSNESLNVSGVTLTRLIIDVLRQCGDDLTRDNVMKQMLSLKNYSNSLMLPGVSITTGVNDYELYGSTRLQRFNGQSWVPFGDSFPLR
jgi:branched-chain amino acid transport system substrate-binding protein